MEGNSVSDRLSGTALYDTAIAAKRVSSCSYCAEWVHFETFSKSKARRVLCLQERLKREDGSIIRLR